MNRGTIIRGAWFAWALLWAGIWGWAASLAAPHPACVEWLLVTTGGAPACTAYGTSGSWLFTELFAVAAVLSVGSSVLSLRKPTVNSKNRP